MSDYHVLGFSDSISGLVSDTGGLCTLAISVILHG